MMDKQIKIKAYNELVEMIKAKFQNAYTDGFYATLENQLNDVLTEAIKNLGN